MSKQDKPGRQPLAIKRADFEKEIERVITEENPQNAGQLWAAISVGPWAESVQEGGISVATLMNRAKLFGLEVGIAGGKRGRAKLSIDKQALQAAIYAVENGDNPPTSHGQLWDRVTEKMGLTCNPQTVKNAAIEYECEIKTAKGKRGLSGEALAEMRAKRVPGQSRSRKGMSDDNLDAYMNQMPDRACSPRMDTLLERAVGGSLKAMVKLNCLQCAGFQPSEIRNCAVGACAFYSIRPYRTKDVDDPEIVENEVVVESEELVEV